MYETILENKLEKIKEDLLNYSNETADRIKNSIECFLNEDTRLAIDIIESTSNVNKKSENIEYKCLKILGLLQPVAKDLRLGAAILRTSTELERINILSAYISRYSIDSVQKGSNFYKPPHITFMSQTVQSMLKDGVGSLLNGDVQILKRSTKNFVTLQEFYNQMFSMYDEDDSTSTNMYPILIGRNLLSIGHHIMGMDDRIAYSIIGKRVTHHKVFYNVLMR
ncbi:MAG TPA: phosphate uptake regulator PhoU [Methanobacterium sp.]|nr:phosphate uptake regulator PhoU [Methanobacterium sp.]